MGKITIVNNITKKEFTLTDYEEAMIMTLQELIRQIERLRNG